MSKLFKTTQNNDHTDSEPDWYLYPRSGNLNGYDCYILVDDCEQLHITEELTLMGKKNLLYHLIKLAWIWPERHGDQRIFCKSIAGNDYCG